MTTRSFHCPDALVDEGWVKDCLIRLDEWGMITAVEPDHAPDDAVRLPGTVVPGMVNVHSHVHQRLIAGLTGYRARRQDSFWTWREQMYGAIEILDADALRDLAAWGFMELLEGGYTSTGEFHYPHRIGGSEPAATARCILDGARSAGMALTLLPVWYQYGGFGRQPVSDRQQTFAMNLDEFSELVDAIQCECGAGPHRVGIAPHSLRAVEVSDLPGLLERIPDGPVHLHIAEQPDEVDACRAHSGTTPVRLLFDHVDIDSRWCLIHATHADEAEVRMIAESGATAGICPTTEADLGDGLFPVRNFLDQGGKVAIGSDSNLVTSAALELRLLEWGQRLSRHERNVLCDEGGHIGCALWQQAAGSGAAALDQPAGRIAPGCRGDFLVMDAGHSLLASLTPDTQLDTLILAHQPGMIDSVYVGGERVVAGGIHRNRHRLEARIRDLRRQLAETT